MTNNRRMMGDKVSLGANLLGVGTAMVTFLAAVLLVATWLR